MPPQVTGTIELTDHVLADGAQASSLVALMPDYTDAAR